MRDSIEGHKLTGRERAVLERLAQGMTAKEISDRLGVRPRTACYHLDNVYRKLGVSSAVLAVRAGMRSGLIACYCGFAGCGKGDGVQDG